MRENAAISAATSEEKISEEAILKSSRILGSPMFIQSDRLSRFLRAVDQAMGFGRISPTLPFIKKKAVEPLKANYSSNDEASRAIPEAQMNSRGSWPQPILVYDNRQQLA